MKKRNKIRNPQPQVGDTVVVSRVIRRRPQATVKEILKVPKSKRVLYRGDDEETGNT